MFPQQSGPHKKYLEYKPEVKPFSLRQYLKQKQPNGATNIKKLNALTVFLNTFLYRYETLAVATDTKGKEHENMSSGKRLAADWVLGLGESASSQKILTPETESKDTPHKIVVLGARTLFVLLDTGKVY